VTLAYGQAGGNVSRDYSKLVRLVCLALIDFFSLFSKYFIKEITCVYYDIVRITCCSLHEPPSS